ncbi:phytoene desaturase family protein [Prevotella aurantiaca]|jgi:putative all-trans-retinol 13,14-reductase|uniref:phytoene desaturase family protein n=1 Tax=Prevotella aurantiaca TaxID=596085 RepID=UPI0023F46F41
MKTVVIIGGGLGGLFAGALLAKEGFKVTILEKNATAGGGLQNFKRFGMKFDTGMHVIGGMRPGGNIYRICQYLGIAEKVQLMNVDDNCADSLYFAEDRTTYQIGKGKEGFIDSLVAHFPEEKKNLQAYTDAIFRLTEEVDLFHLRPSSDMFTTHTSDFFLAADAFIAKYITNPKLRSVVAYMNPLYGGRGDESPAFIHAIISSLYIQGASRFIGGSETFANLLVSVIETYGGAVHCNEEIEWVEVNNRHVDYVRSKKGKIYQADHYISAIHPCTLLSLMSEKAFPKAYRTRLNEIPNAYSAFSVYIKLKPETFPYINHSEYYMTKYDEIWHFGQQNKVWPLGFLFMTPPEDQQGTYAEKALVTAPMSYEDVKKWEKTSVGKRGADYEAWKEEKAQQLLSHIEEIHPGFGACVEQVNTASPLTIRDYYGAKEGTMCGFSKNYKNILLSQVPVVTKVDNLLLTGQNNSLPGFCGVPLTAISTVEAILGRNYILNKINEMTK